MPKPAILFLSICLLALVACASPDGQFQGPEQILESGRAQPLPSLMPANMTDLATVDVPLANLVTDPAAYDARLLQVEGLFLSTPDNVCADKRFGSPISWALADGRDRIAAGGLENLARALPDGEITLVVEGIWRSWPIPANCRQEGDPTQLYYLDVTQIVAPNPIALAPGNGTVANDIDLLATTSLPPEIETTGDELIIVPTATPAVALDQPLPPTGTPAGIASAPPAPETLAGYPAPLATSVPQLGGYPAPTGENGRPDPTLVPAQPTAAPVAAGLLERDRLLPGSLEMGTLSPANSERWTHVISATQALTLQIVPEAGLELIVTIMDRQGTVLSAETSAGPGQLVQLPAFILPEAGEYAILLTTLADGAGNYAILLSDESTYDFLFQGNLVDGFSASGSLGEESDHFYFFSGTAGETVEITATPTAGADLFLRLFDPSGSSLITFHDQSPARQAERIAAYVLPQTGLYALLVGEVDFSGGPYELLLERR